MVSTADGDERVGGRRRLLLYDDKTGSRLAESTRKVIDLEPVRADGWFEQLAVDIPEFEQLCQIVGRRFVAFSFISGVRISSVAYDAHNPHGSIVDFSIGEGGETQQLPLSDLRERLGAALLAGDELEDDLSESPSHDEIRGHIGRRYLLLAPLFGLGLEAIEV